MDANLSRLALAEIQVLIFFWHQHQI